MLVQFVPTGLVQDTTKALPQIGPTVGPYTIPEIGNEGLAGSLTSGNLGYQVVGTGGAYLVWMDKEEVLGRWQMDDAAAVQTGLATILSAVGAGDDVLYLNSDGTAGS